MYDKCIHKAVHTCAVWWFTHADTHPSPVPAPQDRLNVPKPIVTTFERVNVASDGVVIERMWDVRSKE